MSENTKLDCFKIRKLVAIFWSVCSTAFLNGCGNQNIIHEGYYAGADYTSNSSIVSSVGQIVSISKLPSKKSQWNVLEIIHEDHKNPENIILFYSQKSILKTHRASGINSNNNNYWNREHVWPRSYGLKGNLLDRDLHNIVAVDRSINSSRGNKYFDIGGQLHGECLNCRTDNDSWEPTLDVQGDVARIVFYVALMLAYREGIPNKTINTAVSIDSFHFGKLSTLFSWHCNDPVSDYEVRRNAMIFQHQGNRNPFIDHPEWVGIYFDESC